MRRWWAALLVLVIAGLPAGFARADAPAPTVRVQPLEFTGPLDDARRTRFQTRVLAGLGQARLQIVDSGTASYHIVGSVTLEHRDHVIELRVLDSTRKAVVARASRQCEVCGLEEALEAAYRLAATVGGKIDALALAPPMLIVASEPPGAAVRIDGKPVGTTPLRRQVTAGEHELRASKRGFVDETRRVTAVAGTNETVRFDLRPAAKRNTRRAVGWALFGTGSAALAVGIPFVAVDGREVRTLCSGSDVDADGDCRFRHRTLAVGISLAAAGAVLVATGLGLVLAKKRHPKQRAWIRPGGLAVVGAF